MTVSSINSDHNSNTQIHSHKSAMTAKHDVRNGIADTLNMIREGHRRIEEESTYRYISAGFDRMKQSRQIDATCTLLGIVGALISIGSAAHHHQSQTYSELQGISKLFEQTGGGASRLTQAEQSTIQGLIERMQQVRQRAQQDDQEVDRIWKSLDDAFSRQAEQLHKLQTDILQKASQQ